MHALRQANAPYSGPFAGAAVDAPSGAAQRFTLEDELGRRLGRALQRIEHQAPYSREYLLGQISGEPGWWTNFPRFHGDMCGRWILAETRAHAAAGAPPTHLAELVRDALARQNADGSFGVTPDGDGMQREKAYGNGWMLKGLCAYAAAFADVPAQAAAMLLGGHYRTMAPRWAASAEAEGATGAYAATISCYYHGLDGVVALARLTGDTRWRDLAASFIAHLTPLEQADHSHMYLTIRRGVLALRELDGDVAGIAALEAELDRVWAECALETGGMPERFWQPAEGPRDDEACTLADWLLLTSRLFALTGHPRWNDRAILCLENHLYYNQCYNGGFGSCELGAVYRQQGKEAPWCCSLAVPAALITAAAGWVRLHHGTLVIAHLVSGTFAFAGGQTVRIARDDAAGVLRIDLTGAPTILVVRIARPHWLGLTAARAVDDGQATDIPVPTANRTLDVALTWHLWTARPGRAPEPVAGDDAEPVTLFHGPWMLSHHQHRDSGTLPVRLRRGADGRLAGARLVHLTGLTYAGAGFRAILPTGRAQRADDVFRGIGEADGEAWTYCLKDKESPNQSRVTFRLE